MSEKTTDTVEIPATQRPVLTTADVYVIGGGTADFVAAIASARAGASTVLAERNGFLDGCITGTYNTNSGWTNDSDANQSVGGVGWALL